MKPFLLVILCIFTVPSFASSTSITHEQFIQQSFGANKALAKTIWLNKETKAIAENIIQHPISQLRFRYWQFENTTAWVLDEIGKEQPITIGISIHKGTIAKVDILQFRESRGFEIRFPFFTEQFKNLGLLKNYKLNRSIDGISGATLSVSAVKRSTILALFLDQQVSLNEHQ